MIGEIQFNNIATYHAPAILSDLRRINYIFGANGTGKTTISRVIEQADGHEHCHLYWQNSTPLQVMVYNQDFVDRNFNQTNTVKGVFTLGDNQVEAEREIDRLQPEINKLKDDIDGLKKHLNGEDGESGKHKELTDLEPVLRDRCWKQKQLHDDSFQVAFSGVRNNAERFKTKVLSEKASNSADLLALGELKEKAELIFSKAVERESQLSGLSADDLISLENHPLLLKPIVGNQDVDIAALIEQLGNSDWVKQGLHYHLQDPTTCPFCQQSTDESLSKSLESFFSDAYDKDIQGLNQLLTEYRVGFEELIRLVQGNPELNNSFLNVELYRAEAMTLNERLKGNVSLLEAKIAEPSRKITLEPISDLVAKLQLLVAEANTATSSHNQTVTNISAEKQVLTSQVWRYVLGELSDDLLQYEQSKNRLNSTIQGMEASLTTKQQQLQAFESQVQELEKQTTSIHPTKDAINNLLRTFGFSSFHIDVVDERGHYKISRENGDDASRSLSEGEKTFITFLYFYSLIKGAQSASGTTTHRVVVFDDPISSLDSDILYIVSSLMKAAIEEVRNQSGSIKQIFVLTHNVYFHKEVTFNRSRPAGHLLNEESFWLVKKQLQGSIVERCQENPIRSAYELLWEDVKSENVSSLNLQNTLRRIIENYFTMWGGKSKDEICDLFDGREKLICQSLFSWVNDGSHSIHDDLYINHGERTNETYLGVFREIFVRADQLGHYNMMAGYERQAGEGVVNHLPEEEPAEA
ncbi:MAG: AAA family ATPase [Cycloclasticus sp.]